MKITIKMKENDKIKAGKIRFKKLILDTVSPVEIQLNAMDYETAFDGNLYQDYEVGTVDGKTIDTESIRNLKKTWSRLELTAAYITMDSQIEEIDASEMQDLDILNIQYDYEYAICESLFFRFQHITLPIKGIDQVFTRYEYEQLADIIRAKDDKATAMNALDRCDSICENTTQILKKDTNFPSSFRDGILNCYSGTDEAAVIDEYLYEHYGQEITVSFVSNKDTENEIIQEVTLPENIVDHLIEDIREMHNGGSTDAINLPEYYDDYGDLLDLQYVDKIIKN